jgi:hypothetical protein
MTEAIEQKAECPMERAVIDFFGLPEEVQESAVIKTDFGQLVNLICYYKESGAGAEWMHRAFAGAEHLEGRINKLAAALYRTRDQRDKLERQLQHERLVSGQGAQWIPVSERLPNLYEEVLAWVKYKEFMAVVVFKGDKTAVTTRWETEGFDEVIVTHWQPLPTPPTP